MEEAITAFLLGNAALATRIGSRLAWGKMPAGDPVTPYLVVQEISEVERHHLAGPSGLHFSRLQFDCWADTKLSALTVIRVLRTELDGFSGVYSDTRFYRVTSTSRRDMPPTDVDGARVLHRVSQDFECVWSKEN